jgi:serine/threonine protein kinase
MQELKSSYEKKYAYENEQEEKRKKRMKVRKSGLCLQNFGLGKFLGTGSYSTVQVALKITSMVEQRYWDEYALKIMNKEFLTLQQYTENAKREIELLKEFNHPNIISFISHFEDEKSMYLVMEYAQKVKNFLVYFNFTINLFEKIPIDYKSIFEF